MNRIVAGSARRMLTVDAIGGGPRLPEEALAADGMLIVIERDPARADLARRRLASSGLGGRASVITGDPRRMLHKLAGPFDLILCGDADPRVREKLATLLAPEGILIIHDQQ